MRWRDDLIEKYVGRGSSSGVSNSGSIGLGGSILGASVGLCVGGRNGLVWVHCAADTYRRTCIIGFWLGLIV